MKGNSSKPNEFRLPAKPKRYKFEQQAKERVNSTFTAYLNWLIWAYLLA